MYDSMYVYAPTNMMSIPMFETIPMIDRMMPAMDNPSPTPSALTCFIDDADRMMPKIAKTIAKT